jgi:multisubunit Na+/H+ antiporter MnhB subunit
MNEAALLVIDGVLCVALVLLSWRAVNSPRLFESVALFMVFGLLMAVVWARLGSPDLALAEAAIGAGFTGALLLIACREVMRDRASSGPLPHTALPRWLPDWAALGLCLTVGIALGVAMAGGLPAPDLTAQAAAAAMVGHALDHGVTAVLLDFRGLDTLLEMIVLLLAAVGVGVLLDGRPLPDPHPDRPLAEPMLRTLLVLVGPLLGAMAVYLLVAGAAGPGGAFQAGALLGALGVLLRMAGYLVAAPRRSVAWGAALVVGLGAFTLLAVAAPLWSDAALTYPPRLDYPVMIVIEVCLMVSIGATLVLLIGSTAGLVSSRRR